VPREEARLATVHSLSQGAISVLAPEQNLKFDQEFSLWAANPARLAVREHLGGEETTSLAIPLSSRLSASRERSSQIGALRGLDTTLVAGMFFQVLLEAEHLPGNTLERTSFVKQAVKNFMVQRLAGQITLSQFFRLVQIIEHEVTYYFHRLQGEWLSPEDAPPPKISGSGMGYKVAPFHSPQADVLRLALTRLPLPHQANRKLSPEGLFDFLVKSEGRWFRLLDFESHFRLNKKTAWTYLALLLQHDILRHNEEKANKVRYALSLKFLAPEAASLR
jgi:hypothetical protein